MSDLNSQCLIGGSAIWIWFSSIDIELNKTGSPFIGASYPPLGSSMGLPTFFLCLFFLPRPKMALSEAKHSEGNLLLVWCFRTSFLWVVYRTSLFFFWRDNFLLSYGYFLSKKKNSSKMHSQRPNTINETLYWLGILGKASYRYI